jgi:carbamoyltransferase
MTAPAIPAPAKGRLGNGQLRRQVAEWLAARPGPHTVGEVAKDLGRSAGAVGNALATLADRAEASRLAGKPMRYEATAATAAAAAAITPKAPAPPKAGPAAPPAASPAAPKPTSSPAPPTSSPAAPKAPAPAPKAAPGPVTRPGGQVYRPRVLAGMADVEALRTLRTEGVPSLLSGPPGTGKTSLVEAAFPDLITIAGDGDTTVGDFVGEYTQRPYGTYEFIYGPLIRAMQEDRVLFIDDATLISPAVLAVCYPAMDGRREVVVKAHKGETITAADGFFVVAGHNPGVHGAVLTEALSSRFTFQFEVATDYDLARSLGIDSRAITAARNLATRQANGEVGWAPQLRELRCQLAALADALIPAAQRGGQWPVVAGRYRVSRFVFSALPRPVAGEHARQLLKPLAGERDAGDDRAKHVVERLPRHRQRGHPRARTHGWRYLGLCSFTHDSAAALITSGRLTGMVEEERLSGVKHTREYPAAAVQWLLDDAGLAAADIGIVAYNFAGHRYLAGIAGAPGHVLRAATRSRALPRAASFTVIHHRFRQRMKTLQGFFPNARVRYVPHHVAHGMYAFAASGFSEAAVLIIDSLGETCTTSIGSGLARPGGDVRYQIRESIADPASLGYAYGAVTAHLGWRRGDEEGTVMALAATGDPARFRDVFDHAIRLTPAGFALSPELFPLRVLRHGWPRVTLAFTEVTCPLRAQEEEVTQVHSDVAAALQERTEQVMIHLARRAQAVTGARRLCLGGGVAMNCVGTGKILEGGQWDEVYVPPAPGDSGTSIGAALTACRAATGTVPGDLVRSCYLGPAYPGFTPAAVPAPGLTARRVDSPARYLAEQLAAGKIAGLFQGRLEAGPRALGNRSILASRSSGT